MINKENYLSYFLLYVDKELNAKEIDMVHQFVETNADYKAALQQLMLTTFKPEKIIANTDNLYKPNLIIVDGINEQNYEMYFSAAIDNELNKEESIALKNFLIKNPVLALEFEQWNKVKLTNSELLFENKGILYKKENKKPLFYLKVFAAAAVLVLSLGAYFIFTKNDTAANNVVAVNNEAISPTINNAKTEKIIAPNAAAITTEKNTKQHTLKNEVAKHIVKDEMAKNTNAIAINKNSSIKQVDANIEINYDALSLVESKLIKQQINLENNLNKNVTNFSLQRSTLNGTIEIEKFETQSLITNVKNKEEEADNNSEDLIAGRKVEFKKRINIFTKIKNLKNKLNDDIPIKIGNKYIVL